MPPVKPVAESGPNRRRVPAWLMSGALHFLLFVTLSFVLKFTPRGVAIEPGTRAGGIVLVQGSQGKPEYLAEGDAQATAAGGAASPAASGTSSPLPSADQPPVDLVGLLPSASEGSGLGGSAGDALPSAGSFTTGGGTSKGVGTGGGQIQTGVFGVQGTGRKFVYVFDRSGSMSGFQGRPLAAAKSELIASLQSLQSVHQFQIIFYNDQPKLMNLSGGAPRLVYGDENGRRAAAEFIRGIVADGGTKHMEGLKMAVAMQPDVIFFLTDADEPQITLPELAQVRLWNKSETSINTIEFGAGPSSGADNFLRRLARQNHGQHVYVDITKLPATR